jgi:hypothetical protein
MCLAVALLPATVSAAALTKDLKLHDIVALVQANKKPLSFHAEISGAQEKTTGTLTIDGVQNGNLKTLKDAKIDTTLTLNLHLENATSAHAKAHVIVVDSMLYASLDELSTTNTEMKEFVESVKPYMDTWFRFPLDPDEYNAFRQNQENRRKFSVKIIEPYFKITSTQSRDGMQYAITLPKENQRRFLLALARATNRLSPRYGAAMRRSARTTNISLDVMVNTMQNIYASSEGTFTVSTKIGSSPSSFTFRVKNSTLSSMPVITAPAGSMTFEEFVEQQYPSSESSSDIPVFDSVEDARNAQRRYDVNVILNSVYQYSIDHNGNIPATITTTETAICRTGASHCNGLIDLDTLTGSYVLYLPYDPTSTDPRSTEYTIKQDKTTGRVIVRAPRAEKGVSISCDTVRGLSCINR